MPDRYPAIEDHAVIGDFLASEGAGFITGQRIVVAGGRSLGSWQPARR